MNCSATAVGQNQQVNNHVTLYPNPSQGISNVIFTYEQPRNVNIKVYNSLGQLIHHTEYMNVTRRAIVLNLSEQPEGFYQVEISDGQERNTFKVLHQK